MRLEIQRWLLIALISLSYISRVPGLIRQGWIGLPALVVGLLLATLFIRSLLRSSTKGALTFAVFAMVGLIVTLLNQIFLAPKILGLERASLVTITLMAAVPALAAMCAVDLWSAWSTKAKIPK